MPKPAGSALVAMTIGIDSLVFFAASALDRWWTRASPRKVGASRGRALSQRSGQRGPVSSTRQRGPFRNIGPSSFTNPCPGPFVIQ
jgi:hypothetical protein